MRFSPYARILIAALGGYVCHAQVARAQAWNVEPTVKGDANVNEEQSIERRRVVIKQRTTVRSQPGITRERAEMELARKIRLEEKTTELIGQLEGLIQRQGQSARIGELKMRLAELYFERAQGLAAREVETWDAQLKSWESSKQGARPVLKTPQADRLRNRALNLYIDLERMSRGGDQGASRLIHRDEVLFFLASTLTDLDRAKAAEPYYAELVQRFPNSGRVFAARLSLADIFFTSAQFEKAIPHYLRVAAGEGAPTTSAPEEIANLRTYALYKLAWCYMNTAAFPKAVQAFQRTLDSSKGTSKDQRLTFEKEALNDLARAFAMAGQYTEGEQWFEKSGYATKELMLEFRKNVAEMARDRGQWATAIAAIDRIIQDDPKNSAARDLALEKVKMTAKQGQLAAYAKGLAEFTKNYGQGSDWLNAQELSAEDKKALVEDSVGEIRREAKSYHHTAQSRGKPEYFRQALPFYAAYFSVVPNPEPDTPENIHEMRFYYAELLYKLGAYSDAARVYGEVGEGKYGGAAAYSRIVALKAAADKSKDDKSAKELIAATQEFIDKHPKDEHAGDLLYASAYESFHSGSYDESLKTLRQLVERFPDKDKGVEASERILFIYEKKGDLKGSLEEADKILANKTLLAAGGKDYETRVREYRSRAQFKAVETMPESNASEQTAKAQAYQSLVGQLRDATLREKAYNNALVYARKGGDAALVSGVQEALLREFPASKYAKNLYLTKAEELLKQARFREAINEYNAYLKIHAADKDETTDAVMWDKIYVESRLGGFWQPELNPDRDLSPALRAQIKEYAERFPNNKNRGEIIALLAFRRGATEADIAQLRRMHGIDSKDQALLNEAQVVVRARAGNAKELAALTKANPPAKATTELLKEALAKARFRVVEPEFEAYEKKKLNYKPARFAASLKEKITTLEKLDREYMNVVSYGNAESAMRSLERLSKLYRTLAADIEKAPASKEELAPFTKPLADKGIGFLKTCLDKATEYKISGSGVAACRAAADEVGIERPKLTAEVLPEPQWIPQTSSPRPLLKSLGQSLAQNRFGEFYLAASLLEKAEPPLSAAEKAEMSNLSALAEYKMKENQAAVRIFRQVADTSGADTASVRTAAMKNIAALYVQVGDASQALDVLASMPDADADVAWLKALALKAQGKPAEAAQILDNAVKATPGNATLWFNLALAQGAAGAYDRAVTAMNRYVEMETPAGSHVSRVLLREWKAKIK